jgi:thiamine-phosphate pyrophosphorylase
MSWERILDVNLNRLNETLKFLEDIVRFDVYPDETLRSVRRIRAEFLIVKKNLPMTEIVSHRDSRQDRGRAGRFDTLARRTAAETVIATLSRAKESSRIIEEVLKTNLPRLSSRIKEIRFLIYDLEKDMLIVHRLRFDPSFQAVIDETFFKRLDLARTIKTLKKGGCTMVQLRAKHWSDREFLRQALRLRKLCCGTGLTFIVNDRVDICRLASADGVHLGADDLPVPDARRLLGPSAVIGASAVNLAEAIKAQGSGADYIGAGAVFPTPTKPEARVCGLRGLRCICRRIKVPVIAIGGIAAANVRSVRRAGAAGIAVCSALFSGPLEANLRSLTRK